MKTKEKTKALGLQTGVLLLSVIFLLTLSSWAQAKAIGLWAAALRRAKHLIA